MKKVLAMAAAAALACGASAFAANPFSDVSTSDWAYQAISQLSDQGMVEGYPDGTFKGQQNITRYEAAQIVARLLAREDQLNAEQKATVNKLAAEYADELENLGVRVSNVEKKIGNLSFGGDARMMYNDSYDNGTVASSKDKKDNWTGRVRIGVTGTVDDSTYVYGRLRSNLNFVNDAGQDDNTYMDRLFVHHQFGKDVGVTLGRSELFMGATGIFYDERFDGVRAKMGTSKLNLDLGYGRLKVWDDTDSTYPSVFKNTNPDAFYASLKGKISKATIGVDYLQVGSKVGQTINPLTNARYFQKAKASDDYQIWGVNLNVPVQDRFSVFGDYYQNPGISGNPKFYVAGLSYGTFGILDRSVLSAGNSKVGAYNVSVMYGTNDQGTYLGGTTLNIDPNALTYQYTNNKEVKYWLATADVIVAKNLDFNLQYAFNVKADQFNGGTRNYGDLTEVALNYKF